MGILIQLAIYAAIVAGAAFAFHEFEQVYYVAPAEKRGAANQLAADLPVLEGVKTDRDHWKKAEGDREAENTAMGMVIDRQNQALVNNKKLADANVAASHAIAARQTETAAAFAADNEKLRLAAATKEPARAADEELKLVVPYLDDALAARKK